MPVPQQKFRELVFQMLYSHDTGYAQDTHVLPMLMEELAVTKKTVLLAKERVQALLAKLPEIDLLISNTVDAYSFERIHTVERNVLRLGVFELVYDKNLPGEVALAEAMRLAKKFGSPESIKFVNAILDQIYKKISS